MSVQIKIKKNEYDEYEVQWIENGIHSEAKTYYTNDKEDAELNKVAMEKEALAMTKLSATEMASDRIAEDLEAYEERMEKKANRKIWQAKVTGVIGNEELIGMLQLIKQCHGKLCLAHPTITGIVELIVQFKSKNDVEAFDVAVCDLGYDIEWKGKV